MKEADRCMEIILMAFPKNSFFEKMGHLGPRMAHTHNSGSTVRIALQFCTMKGAKRDKEINLMVFLKKILFRAIWSFWPKMVRSYNFGSDLRTFLNIAQ